MAETETTLAPEALLERHKPKLIETLRNATPATVQGNEETKEFLNIVLEDEEKVATMPPRRPVLPGEDVFWWCVEQLLLVTDIVRPATDPYLQMIVEDLKGFADRLENGEELPPGYQVGWLDFDEQEVG